MRFRVVRLARKSRILRNKSLQKSAPDAQANGRAAAGFLAALGHEVRRHRAKRGMTRRQLAEASRASERYLAQIESGAANPSVSVVRAIAQALDLPAFALLPEKSARATELGVILDLLAKLPEADVRA